MSVDNLEKLLGQFKGRIELARDASKAVIVGYAANYAVYVHEDLTKNHTNGQAQFLIEPARAMKDEIGSIIASSLKSGKPLREALLDGGVALLEASKELVPVLTGFLRDSGYVEVDVGESSTEESGAEV